MSSFIKPFFPNGPTKAVVPTTAGTARVAIVQSSSQIRVFNDHTATVFYKVGADNTVTADATGIPIPAGGIEVVSIDTPLATPYVAAYIASGSATNSLYITPGAGN